MKRRSSQLCASGGPIWLYDSGGRGSQVQVQVGRDERDAELSQSYDVKSDNAHEVMGIV